MSASLPEHPDLAQLLADRATLTVQSVEVDGAAIVLGLAVGREAEAAAARPAPPQRLYQVFTVADGQIVEIRGYPDQASALAHS